MIRTARFALLICLLIKVTARAISSDAYELLSSRELGAACRDKDIDSLLISENEKLLVAVDHIPIVQKRSTPTGAAYTYYGGPVISNVEITVIFHGAATNYQLELEKYYQFLVNSSYIDVLAEYSTKTQIISRGSFKGTYVEQNVFNKTVLDDIKDIQPYVVNLVKSGVINPTANSLYPIHFAPGYQISQGGGGLLPFAMSQKIQYRMSSTQCFLTSLGLVSADAVEVHLSSAICSPSRVTSFVKQ
ncbi:hypothetical protein HDU84_001632 [Entophlyctis sp. JEL0112]|nr:hypothetical protein HDU84_001632 [Entophlyctis sp. JEL0112]